jgi:hypothetical protein
VNPSPSPTPTPVPVDPSNPTGPTTKDKIKMWFHDNGLWVAIGGGVVILILLIIIGICCYKKSHKPDPYMNRPYTTVDEEEVRLDEDRKETDPDAQQYK